MNIKEVAELIGAEIVGHIQDSQIEINGVAPLTSAGQSQITFLVDDGFKDLLPQLKAGAVIVKQAVVNCPSIQLIHKNPYYAFAKISQKFVQDECDFQGVSTQAFVHPQAKVAPTAVIYPHVYVSSGAEIGEHTVLFSGVFIGKNARIGSYTRLRANVVVEHECVVGDHVLIHANTTIGADGFGFAPGSTDIAKIPQVGRVVIEDHVEIGASSTVDRGTMDDTKIGCGTKLDSQVHVGHNVVIGSHSLLCGGAMLAGSCTIGNWVTLAGGVDVGNKVKIADKVVVAAKSGVTKDINEPGYYAGFPTQSMNDWRKEIANIRIIPMLRAKIKELEMKIKPL